MKKTAHIGMGKAAIGIATAIASLAGMTAPATASVPATPGTTQNTTDHRDALTITSMAPMPGIQVRKQFGFYGEESNKPSRFLNQRQYRKMVRQNPWLKKSKNTVQKTNPC